MPAHMQFSLIHTVSFKISIKWKWNISPTDFLSWLHNKIYEKFLGRDWQRVNNFLYCHLCCFLCYYCANCLSPRMLAFFLNVPNLKTSYKFYSEAFFFFYVSSYSQGQTWTAVIPSTVYPWTMHGLWALIFQCSHIKTYIWPSISIAPQKQI